MLLAYGMIVMILMSLGVALTQMKVFSFKDALITSTGRVIIGPIIGFVVIKADDQSKINMNGKILTISGFIEHLIFKSSN